MKNILVTGANGFVGHHVAKELAEHGYRVTGIGGNRGSTDTPPHLADYMVVDLNDPSAVAGIDFTAFEGVIHLAGLAAVGPSFDQPMEYISGNIGMEINLFEAALQQKAQPRFVIISSGSLYDGRAALPLTELSTVVPNSPYAVSKLGQEQMATYYQNRGFECIIARPFNHIGPGQGLGFIVPDLTKQVLDVASGTAEKVLVGNLDAARDYTDVRDIAVAYRLLVESGRPGEIYNICSGSPTSGRVILDKIVAASDTNPPIEQDPSRLRPADNPLIFGSHAKLTADTGWQPVFAIDTTIADVVADWRNR